MKRYDEFTNLSGIRYELYEFELKLIKYVNDENFIHILISQLNSTLALLNQQIDNLIKEKDDK